MNKTRLSSAHVLRISIVLLAGTCVVYITLYNRATISGAVTSFQLPDSAQIEKDQSREYNFKELRRNLTVLSDKMKRLYQFMKQDGFDLDEMTESTDFSRMNPNVSTPQPTSLLTLFTTVKWSNEKASIYEITFMNWASLRPVVNPVLFTNDSVAANKAKKYGWMVMNSTKSTSNGLPVLKHMYLSVMKTYRSQFYSFANSDILFDGGLVKTLVNIHYSDILSPLKHVLITGIRFNVVNVNKSEILQRKDIKTLADTRGEIFVLSAEDYFITDRFYPWKSIPEVVIASPVYDNWLVMNAREKRHLVIDASKTITVVHQSQDTNHHRSHWRDTSTYNANLLREISKMNVPYHKGFLNCIERFTEISDDTLFIRERTVDAYCN